MIFGCEQFLDIWVLVVGIFFLDVIFFGMECGLSWNDELNFCVAEPQESR